MTTTAEPPTEATTKAVPALTEEDVKSENTLATVNHPTHVLILNEIKEGVNKGFKFWSKNYKTLKDAIEHFTKLSAGGKPGEALVLGLVNAALDFRLRSRANAKLTYTPKKDDAPDAKDKFTQEKKAWLKDPEKSVVINQEDADEYVPGERDVNALSGLIKQKTDLIKAIKLAKEAGNIEEAKLQASKYYEVVKMIEERQKKEEAEILAML